MCRATMGERIISMMGLLLGFIDVEGGGKACETAMVNVGCTPGIV